MRYANVKYPDIANGEGVRVSLFVSGCRHHCPGCFNVVAQDFEYGDLFTDEVIDGIMEKLRPDYIKGLTILGGEPMEPENQPEVLRLIKRVRDELPNKTVWLYSGFTLEQLRGDSRGNTPYTEDILSRIDMLVDGPFIEREKDISLRFRGSRNQRLLTQADINNRR